MPIELTGLSKYIYDPLQGNLKEGVLFKKGEKGELIPVDPDENGILTVEADDGKTYYLEMWKIRHLQNKDYKLRKRVIHNLSLNIWHKTPRDLSKYLNMSDTKVYNMVNAAKGDTFIIRDMLFQIEDAVLPDHELENPRPFYDTKLEKYIPSARKRVICVNTGKIYNSITEAAAEEGVTKGYLGTLIRKNKPHKGNLYRLATEEDLKELDKITKEEKGSKKDDESTQ